MTAGWVPTFVFEGRIVDDGVVLRQTKKGGWAQAVPVACRNNHRFGPGKVLVGSQACQAVQGGSHRTYQCEADGCGEVVYVPAVTAACEHTEFDGRSRGEHQK